MTVLMSMRILTLIIIEIFIWAPKIMRKEVMTSIWICYPSRTKLNHMFHILGDLG